MDANAPLVRRHVLALAALLHDLGKFAHRAAALEFRGAWQDPATHREFRYAHAYLTHLALDALLPQTPWKAEVQALAAYHHAPQNPDQRLIRLADQLSAGERASGAPDRDDAAPGQHPRLLHPIFARVRGPQGETHPHADHDAAFFVPLGPLQLTRAALFPQGGPTPDAALAQRYAEMWEQFTQAAGALRRAAQAGALDLPAYLEAMQALLMRFTWSIPAAYWRTYADISLYDHSRTTAALAAALADFDADHIATLTAAWQVQKGSALDEPVALLVGGDLSGVQKFIYTIAAKGAAKMLRGRSFYLQLLTEAALRYVLRSLALPYTSVIYTGGGNFYLLAPLSARQQLDQLQADIGRVLWAYHGADLHLVLAAAEVPLRGFLPGRFPHYWGTMHRALQARKRQRYAVWPAAEMHATVFAVPEHGGNPDAVCSVCGSETRQVTHWDEWEGQERLCTLCRSFAAVLGKALPHAAAVAWRWVPPVGVHEAPVAGFDHILRALGAQVQLLPHGEPAPDDADALWLLDDPPATWTWPAKPVWLRYSVTQIPVVRSPEEAEAINARLPAGETQRARVGLPKTFGQLQVQTRGGFHRLGVLRMDVDHLGLLFAQGLGERATLSRLAALSFQMSLFFEGWVERILEDGPWANLIYAVYAGGDDLFLVGPWDVMPDLALRIVDDFTAYTGGHPALHLSGGLAFMHGKYPIYQAAADAGEAEEQAKAAGRHRFAFLGRVWTWPAFRELQARKAHLVALVQAEAQGENRALLRVVQNLARQVEAAADPADRARPRWGPWMWRAAYQLTRMADLAAKDDPARAEEYRALLAAWQADNFAALPAWGVAARWAELDIRKPAR